MANKYTNSGLVSYCKAALKLKTKYMWGGLFRPVTASYVTMLAQMYPKQYPSSRKADLSKNSGYYGVDCVGLVKSYYFGGVGSPSYNGAADYGVGTMYKAAKTKGKIATFDRVPGRLVMTADFGHVGVYIGDNKVIESTLGSRGDGVVQSNFSAVSWANWCQCPCIEDDTSRAKTAVAVDCKTLFQAVGVPAIRAGASTGAKLLRRCERGSYYAADQIVTPPVGSQKWIRHIGGGYSAITEVDGSVLLKAAGKYTIIKAAAPVYVRSGAGTSFSALGKLATEDEVVRVGSTTKTTGGLTWVQVLLDGKLGWCDRQWVKM